MTRQIFLLGSCVLLFTGACAERSEPDGRPNLILISLDTTRADHFGSYGHDRDTTPNLDALAASANRYENAYAPGPWTYTSHIEMLTGQIPQEIGIYTGRNLIPESIPVFAEHLAVLEFDVPALVGTGAAR